MNSKSVPKEVRIPPTLAGVASFSGVSLYCNIVGEGDPLVLITGELLDSRIWNDQIAVMAEEYKVLRYDLRGTGQSTRIITPYSHTNDLEDLLKFLSMYPAHVLGIIEGANIALELALRHPEYVRSLIFVAPRFRGYVPQNSSMKDIRNAENTFAQLFTGKNSMTDLSQIGVRLIELTMSEPSFAPSLEHLDARQRAQTIMRENIPQSFDLQLQLPLWDKPPAVQHLDTVHVPTLVLVGGLMAAGDHVLADTVLKSIRGAKKVTLPNAPALMNMDQPEAFNRAVLDFLQPKTS